MFGSREEALETYREILARVQPGLEQLLPRDTLTGGVIVVLYCRFFCGFLDPEFNAVDSNPSL